MRAASQRLFFTALLLVGSLVQDCSAWVYPEHRHIALLAIERLDAPRREVLNNLWTSARSGQEGRLTVQILDSTLGRKPEQLDFASWPAIAGDHSCSPASMLVTVLESPWILKVADIGARLEDDLARFHTRSKRINALRNSDIRLQRADPEYATRAGSNNAHFLLARTDLRLTGEQYITACLAPGAALNALGVYAYYHQRAMEKAAQAFRSTEQSRRELALAALADEAFAIHFLEDAFAAGHIAGTRGNASLRKGTHDYYNENGLEIVTWDGLRAVVHGDAHMRSSDAALAAAAVCKSLEQLADAAGLLGQAPEPAPETVAGAETFDVCTNDLQPASTGSTEIYSLLLTTPVPGLSADGELPRFSAEMGLFAGFSAGAQGIGVARGFGAAQSDPGAIGSLDFNVRIGFGMEGVLNESGDGLIFLQAGIARDGNSSNQIVNTSGIPLPTGALTSAIPGRQAYAFRLRMPFYLFPGDLLVAGPLLALLSPRTLTKMAVASANGGLIPWQSGIATPIGRFQFVLGREVNVCLYGLSGNARDATFIPIGNELYWVQFRSTKLDFPFLEYRPFRFFTSSQSSSLLIQLSAGVDMPYHATTLIPEGGAAPELKSIGTFGIRLVFNWRHYL
jgi:hypothetical protein